MPTDPTPDLATLDALLAAATPGPWEHSSTQWVSATPWSPDLLPGPAMVCVTNGNDPRREANAALIAAAVNALPALLRDIREMRKLLRKIVDGAEENWEEKTWCRSVDAELIDEARALLETKDADD